MCHSEGCTTELQGNEARCHLMQQSTTPQRCEANGEGCMETASASERWQKGLMWPGGVEDGLRWAGEDKAGQDGKCKEEGMVRTDFLPRQSLHHMCGLVKVLMSLHSSEHCRSRPFLLSKAMSTASAERF